MFRSIIVFIIFTAASFGVEKEAWQDAGIINFASGKGISFVDLKEQDSKRCLAITGPMKNWSAFSRDGINLKGNLFYEISFSYKTQNCGADNGKLFSPDQSFQIRPRFKNKKIQVWGDFKLCPSIKWQKTAGYFYAPENANATVLFSAVIPKGEILIDDIKIQKMNDDLFKGNLIKNGDFEQNLYPSGWSVSRGYKMKHIPLPEFSFDSDNGFYDGKRSLKIKCAEGDAFILKHKLPSRNGKTYSFKAWIKSDKKQMPLSLWVNSRNGESAKHWYQKREINATDSWKLFEIKATVPGNACNVYYSQSRPGLEFVIRNDSLKNRQAGTIIIDRVEAYETD